ncbi:ABC-type branched-subunit amino acid transport system ATPase component [Bradyrhizobium sp. LM3.2]
MHHLNKLDTKMALLEVKDLKVRVEEREILHGLTLTVNEGEIHAIMGPNGSGKSTLSHVIAGKPGYEVTDGEILFKGEDLLAMAPNERAAKGVFLAFPVSGRDSRRLHHEFPAHRAECAAQGARRERIFDA